MARPPGGGAVTTGNEAADTRRNLSTCLWDAPSSGQFFAQTVTPQAEFEESVYRYKLC